MSTLTISPAYGARHRSAAERAAERWAAVPATELAGELAIRPGPRRAARPTSVPGTEPLRGARPAPRPVDGPAAEPRRTARPVHAPGSEPRRTARPARPASPGGQVRLTRRGRLVVFLLAMAFVLSLGVLLGARSMATGESGQDQPTRVVMVDEGETLWDIAAGIAKDGEVRSMMHQIEQLNGLESGMLLSGQELHVPVTD
jgi:hypothetical protein